MKKGFTLAEVLITLGIVGVVAALTIPNAVGNYQKKMWVTQLQKAYNQIATAANNYMTDNGISRLNELGSFNIRQFFDKYFTISGYCENDNIDKCLAPIYYSLDGTENYNVTELMKFAINDFGQYDGKDDELSEALDKPVNKFLCANVNTGATICLTPMGTQKGCTDGIDGCHHMHSVVVVDVNGKSGPNIKGRDYFQFDLYSDGKIGNNHSIIYNKMDLAAECTNRNVKGYGNTCFTKIINDGWKMDY